MRRRLFTLIVLLLLVCVPRHASADQVQSFVRVKGQGKSVLRGIGLVMGLNGTGDSGKELVMARPLATVLANEGAAVSALKELEKVRTVALVMVTCTIPETGGVSDDEYDCQVAVINSATSLKGGRLYLAPLRGPFKGSPVFAIAQGSIDIEDETTPTVAKVSAGAQLIRDITMEPIGDEFDLILNTHFQGWSAAAEIAQAINGDAQRFGPKVAVAMDARTVRVRIPPAERTDRANFLASVFSASVSVSAMELPAQVICNRRKGAIVATGDVTIEPVAITHEDLTITTTIPPPEPTARDPLVRRDSWVGVQSPAPKPGEATKLEDLLAAFRTLDIPVSKQIGILEMLHNSGKLRAKFIVE
jgi:flagellar P-ring protein precursor FlgI